MIDLVEGAARARGDEPVPRQYIEEALNRIEAGLEDVPLYPGGRPSLKAVYTVAARLAGKG